MIRILLTGGGTGGHVYPLLAVAKEMRGIAGQNNIELDLRYVGTARQYHPDFEAAGIACNWIAGSKWRRYISFGNIIDIPKFFISIIQAAWHVFRLMPDAVFSKGGTGAVPVIIAARIFFIPVIIHESDSIPGLTNRISGKLAKLIFAGFASALKYFPERKTEIVGDPIRPDLVDRLTAEGPMDPALAKRSFGFDAQAPLLLILGGSQGMAVINDFVLEHLQALTSRFQILHQVGERNYEAYKREYEFISKDWSELEKSRYLFRPYFSGDLFEAYCAADIVLARAGATTIFELAFFGKPALLIPLPGSANHHQSENARQYAAAGAAVVFEQENILGGLVEGQLDKLLNDREKLRAMSEAARLFYKPDAAMVIAENVLKIAVH